MYTVKEYYLLHDKVQSHPVSIRNTLKEAYETIKDVFNMDPRQYFIIPDIPEKYRKEFIEYALNKCPNKQVLTILKE